MHNINFYEKYEMFQDFLFSFFSNYFQSSVNLKIVYDCSGNIETIQKRFYFLSETILFSLAPLFLPPQITCLGLLY